MNPWLLSWVHCGTPIWSDVESGSRGVYVWGGGVRLTSRQISLKLTHNRLMVSANPQTKVWRSLPPLRTRTQEVKGSAPSETIAISLNFHSWEQLSTENDCECRLHSRSTSIAWEKYKGAARRSNRWRLYKTEVEMSNSLAYAGTTTNYSAHLWYKKHSIN